MVATVGYLQPFAAAGVVFHSFSEPALCSDNEMVRDIVLAVMSSLAKAERQRISARTKAGLERVRKSGKHIGRPSLDPKLVARIRELVREQPNARPYAIGRAIGV